MSTAWCVTFGRDRLTPTYQYETLIVVAAEGRLQSLLDGVRSVHPNAVVITADNLGEAVWAVEEASR